MYEMDSSVYGISLYSCWMDELLVKMRAKCEIDYRNFYAVYEHKLMMRRRIKYMRSKFIDAFQELEEDINKLISKTERLRLMALKYNVTMDSRIMMRIVESIKETREIDYMFMCNFYDELSRLVLSNKI